MNFFPNVPKILAYLLQKKIDFIFFDSAKNKQCPMCKRKQNAQSFHDFVKIIFIFFEFFLDLQESFNDLMSNKKLILFINFEHGKKFLNGNEHL